MQLETVGQRAAKEIQRRVIMSAAGRTAPFMKRLGLDRKLFYTWINGGSDPSAAALRVLALEGFDIYYILTGKRKAASEGKAP